MPLVTNLSAQSERDARCIVNAPAGIYDPMGGTVTLLDPQNDISSDGPFTITFEQGGLSTSVEEMQIDSAASNARELCFVKTEFPFAPPLDPRATVVGEPMTDLTGIISPLPWADAFRLGVGVNAVTGGIRRVALKPFTPILSTTRRTSEHYRFVQNESDLSQELELSASGKYNIEGVDVSASASYLSHIKFSELFISLVAQYESVFDQYDEAGTYELTDEAKAILTNPLRFREEFGDYFVAGVRRFSRFTAVYRCQSSSAESMEEFKTSLGAEAPQVFSVEGSARFMQLAKTHNISIEIQIDEHGFEGQSPNGPPWTPEKILLQLAWCKQNLGGSPFQAKLAHYSLIAPRYPQTVQIAPSVFVELRQLYTTVWDVRTRYDSCPRAYKEQFKKDYTALTEGVMANKTVLATDASKRLEYQRMADVLLARLSEVYARMDFYLKVQRAIGTEPARGSAIVEGTGVQTWLYGYKEYAKSSAVNIASTEMRYAEQWHIGYREHTFEFGPNGNNLIVGWQVISNWNDGTNGSFWKEVNQIISTDHAAVHVKSRYDRGCDWTVRVFYVPRKDYLFDDTITPLHMQKVRPIKGGTIIAGPKKNGTLGLVVKNLATEKPGILTAGHVLGGQHTSVGQPTTADAVGLVQINTFAPRSSSDIAFAPVVAGVEYDLETIWRAEGSFEIAVMAAYPDKDQKIKMCGTIAGTREGKVVYQNANVDVVEDGVPLTLKGISIATYPSAPGDSGAPVVSADREEVEWLGIHGGSLSIEGQRYSWFTPLATINAIVRIYDVEQKQDSPAVTLEGVNPTE